MKVRARHSLAVMVLALLGAGCADEPPQAGQAAAQPDKVAAAAPAAAAGDDPIVECDDDATTGTMIHKKVCYTASQKAQQQKDAQLFQQQTEHSPTHH